MDECIKVEYLQDPVWNKNLNFKMWNKNLNFKIKKFNSMKTGKRGVLNRSCKFCYSDQHASIKKS